MDNKSGRAKPAIMPIMPRPLEAPHFAAEKRESVRAKIAGFAGLPDNFDGNGGRAAARKDIDNALSFIPHLPPEAVETARVMYAGEGDIMLDWKRPPRCLEIGFVGGEISFFGDMPNGEQLGGDAAYAKGGVVPADLRRLISALFAAQ